MLWQKKIEKRRFTYIEMMMVLLLITIIGGTLVYNMQGGVAEAQQLEKKHAAHFIELALVHALHDHSSNLQTLIETGQWNNVIDQMPLLDERKRQSYKEMLRKQQITIAYEPNGMVKVTVVK